MTFRATWAIAALILLTSGRGGADNVASLQDRPAVERARMVAETISQPYIVALMTELVRPRAGDRALDVGTGSGYQAAVLSRLVSHVYTIEIVEPLGRDAERRLKTLGYPWPPLSPQPSAIKIKKRTTLKRLGQAVK